MNEWVPGGVNDDDDNDDNFYSRIKEKEFNKRLKIQFSGGSVPVSLI